MDTRQLLMQRWLIFLNIIIDPWISILSALNIIIVWMNTNDNNHVLSLILSLLTVFSSGILGARLMKIWSDATNENLLVSRGKISIRNLILLIENICIIKKRIQIYINRQNEEQSKKSTVLSFEELIEKCNILEREVINSIESWSDIIPDANISTKLEDISLTSKYIKKEKLHTEKLKRELDLMKTRPEKDKEELKNIIIQKIKSVVEKEREIDNKIETINSSILGGINIYSLSKLASVDKSGIEVN